MINVDGGQLEHARRVLGHIPKGAPKAISRAINRAAESARTEASRTVRDLYYINVKDVRSTITITKAQATAYPMAWVKSRGTRRPLIQFKVSPTASKRVPAVLRVGVKRENGLKNLPGAFVNRGSSSGVLHVLKRVGKSRYPIHIKYGPSVPEMMGTEKVSKAVEQKATETLGERLDHEVNRLLEAGNA